MINKQSMLSLSQVSEIYFILIPCFCLTLIEKNPHEIVRSIQKKEQTVLFAAYD